MNVVPGARRQNAKRPISVHNVIARPDSHCRVGSLLRCFDPISPSPLQTRTMLAMRKGSGQRPVGKEPHQAFHVVIFCRSIPEPRFKPHMRKG